MAADDRRSTSIPWVGRTATLRVVPSLLGRTASLLVDDQELARVPKPTGEQPWVQCEVPGSDPVVVVVLIARRDLPADVAVFVDGRNVRDGMSLEYCRRQAPRPQDKFEQAWGASYFSRAFSGSVFGMLMAAPFVLGAAAASNGRLLVYAAEAFVLGFGYVRIVALLIRALLGRPGWPVRLRYAVALGAVIGLPALALGLLSSVQGS